MSYTKLPSNIKMTPETFIKEMNRALASLPFYRQGMVVCSDENGYWLEIEGDKDTGDEDLLSAARRLVLGK